MKQLALALVACAVVASGCDLIGGGGGGTGGGAGGGSGVTFSKGYVFIRKDDRNVYIADEADLQTTARLTTSGGARTPSLSHDGKRVTFARVTAANATELVTVPSAGGTESVVLSASTAVKNLRTPIFSKDDAQLYFAYDVGPASAVGVVNLDGTGFKSIAGSSSLSYSSPSLSADGLTLLAAAGGSPSTLSQLERITISTGMPVNVTNALGVGAEGGVVVNRVVMSPDGTKAVYDGRATGGGTRIFVINLSTKVVTKATEYTADPNTNDSYPSWVGSDKFAFSSDNGGNDQVYVLPATSSSTSGGLTLPKAVEPFYGP